MEPFILKEISKKGFFSKLLGLEKIENAATEINNLLAEAKDINEVTREKIEETCKKWNVKLDSASLIDKLKNLVEKFLIYTITTKDFSEFLEDCHYVLNIFGLSITDFYNTSLELLKIFGKKIIEDEEFTQDEKKRLEDFRRFFQIKEKDFKQIWEQLITEKLKAIVQAGIQDGRWSPDEEQRLWNFAKEFQVDLTLDSQTQKMLEKLSLVWKIENNQISTVQININLKKDENCYYFTKGEILERKKKVVSYGYTGRAISFRIAKGIYLTGGSSKRIRDEKEVIETMDSGNIYVTNQRVIFIGNKKSLSTPYNKILNIDIYSDAIILFKEQGKPVIFSTPDSEILGLFITKFLSI
ncbi:hypothetical protein [Thermodesulfovibrio yellowstonii]|uniref:Uncharacterized protein n=2 Tax=Thermodesulfovibrio yellowstonii TaxID=28262 RepID=B5YJK2_THEYD|nr:MULTISPECIES: hypothetical protein [Thermodesulfovibrio]ACI20320.1 hypothetical protein THEYE_A0574 [Thermodesulfovibrio yellowstonii DSM 11347]MDI6864330.1 hypothetical protein [Thermodesulfovibrio yellowstonii]GLI54056.1 hypothetical protein TISLANDTSLP1_17490 [Thermodesulfovibrio islandicus]